MNCPYCEKEMKKGSTSFTTPQGLTFMTLSYTSDEEAKKGFFSRKTLDKNISPGEKTETYHCPCCKKIITIFDI